MRAFMRTQVGPAQIGFVLVTLLAIAGSQLSVLADIRFALVFGYLMLVPGYAFVRLLHFIDGWHILMLTLATSIGISSAVSVGALYAHWWSPNGILIFIGVLTVLAAFGESVLARFPTLTQVSEIIESEST
jgi:hypothetical protein